jgi:hypothetical protein
VAYTKLDENLVTSSVWSEDDKTLRVWVYLMARAGANGAVLDTVPAIARACNYDLATVDGILAKLAGPDPYSRTREHEGRRIAILHDPEFAIYLLNHGKYRGKDHTSAHRQRDYRERLRSGMDARLESQDGKCDCCGSPFEEPYSKFVVGDHHHPSEQQRGLICQSCNKIVGQIENGQRCLTPKKGAAEAYIAKWEALRDGHVTGDVTHAPVTQAEAEAEANNRTSAPADADVVLAYWSERTCTNLRSGKVRDKTLSRIRARLKDGFSVADMKACVDYALESEFYRGKGYHKDPAVLWKDAERVQKLATGTQPEAPIAAVALAEPDGPEAIAERAMQRDRERDELAKRRKA